jgi:signal transduction histidine kinase
VLYRVAQEALTNVAKHAKAQHARVALQVRHGQVALQVGDDGTGFATTHPADPIGDHLGLNHFGLASMRQQLEMAGGSLQVRSRPGQGTTISATLPVIPEPAPASTR